MKTTETLNLLLDKLPPTARTAHRCPGITHNLLAVSTLCNSGCSVLFLKHGVTVEFNGEIVLRGWRDQRNDLWRVPITSKGEGHIIIPPTPPADYNPSQGRIMQSLINSIYECDNTKEIIRYYHADFLSPTKHRMLAAEKLGYCRWCPGLTRK